MALLQTRARLRRSRRHMPNGFFEKITGNEGILFYFYDKAFTMNRTGIKEIDYYFFGTDALNFKRDILLFDKIIVLDEALKIARYIAEELIKGLKFNHWDMYNFNNQNIEALERSGHLEVITIKSFLEKFQDSDALKRFDDRIAEKNIAIESILESPYRFNFLNRLFASVMAEETGNVTLPILADSLFNQKMRESNAKTSTLNFILSEVPEPGDDVSWDQIFDFKNDVDTQKKYYRLINWVNEVSKGDLTGNEIIEKYKELLFEYTDRFRIHKMKHKAGIVEIVATVATKIATLKFDEATNALFSIAKKEVNLLEAEASFPGREIAYIYKAKEQFEK